MCRDVTGWCQKDKGDKWERQVNGFKSSHKIAGPQEKINASSNAVRAAIQEVKVDWGQTAVIHRPEIWIQSWCQPHNLLSTHFPARKFIKKLALGLAFVSLPTFITQRKVYTGAILAYLLLTYRQSHLWFNEHYSNSQIHCTFWVTTCTVVYSRSNTNHAWTMKRLVHTHTPL